MSIAPDGDDGNDVFRGCCTVSVLFPIDDNVSSPFPPLVVVMVAVVVVVFVGVGIVRAFFIGDSNMSPLSFVVRGCTRSLSTAARIADDDDDDDDKDAMW